jgi:hypothetical protein
MVSAMTAFALREGCTVSNVSRGSTMMAAPGLAEARTWA